MAPPPRPAHDDTQSAHKDARPTQGHHANAPPPAQTPWTRAQPLPALLRPLERGAPTPSKPPPPTSYLDEASFLLNPLSGRLPARSPHRAAPSARSGALADAAPLTYVALDSVDATLQDALLVEDLFYVLMGFEGHYIRFAQSYRADNIGHRLNGPAYVLDAAMRPSLRTMVERLLPVATYYISIYAFVECESGLEYGTVMHALCAAIRQQLHKYEALIASMQEKFLSAPDFALHQMSLELGDTLRTYELIHAITSDIASITHASVLPRDDDDHDNDSHDDDDGGDDDDDNDDDNDSLESDSSELERERRALLGFDDDIHESVLGGIVKGGEVLALLWDRLTQLGGDPTAHALYLDLFHEASQPYARTLLRWITSGVLDDPYEEFMVVEDARVSRASLESDPTDEYWERRYMLRDERALALQEQLARDDAPLDHDDTRGALTGGAKIPAFLEGWKTKILLAGKYLNAIRECGLDVSHHASERVHALFGAQDAHVQAYLERDARAERIIMDDADFEACIERAYQRANAALLSLLKNDKDIIRRLYSLKHYFFFAHADFLQTFFEQADPELKKWVDPHRVRETTLLRLQTQLDTVLNSSDTVGFHDPYREELRVDVAKERAYDQLQRIADTKGVVEIAKLRAKHAAERQQQGTRDAVMYLLQFDVRVQFPVSLVISKKNILRWQFVHRSLLLLKILERALTDVWAEQAMPPWRSARRHTPPHMERWAMRVHLLRQRMLLLVQQLLAFYTSEVLEPHWRDLVHKLEHAPSVDQFMKHHFDFLNTCRKECMLTDYRYLECQRKLMNTITAFTESKGRLTQQLEAMAHDPAEAQADATSPDNDLLAKIEASWNKHARVRRPILTQTFRDVVNLLSTTDNPAALPLAYRLQTSMCS